MSDDIETAAVLALLRERGRAPRRQAVATGAPGAALAMLEAQHGLLTGERLDCAMSEIDAWRRRGIEVVSPADARYPRNLGSVRDRPPLLFVAGELSVADDTSIAVIGSRQATAEGIGRAHEIARTLVEHGFSVVSGLAAGIDAAAHSAALACGGRTVAVIGTGLDRCYPAEHAELQREIARRFAVVSQFWPESPPSRSSFPLRNAVMSGIALGTVIVEASHTSGARIQSRLALAQGRPVLLLEPLLAQRWARELATRDGVHLVRSPDGIIDVLRRVLPPAEIAAVR